MKPPSPACFLRRLSQFGLAVGLLGLCACSADLGGLGAAAHPTGVDAGVLLDAAARDASPVAFADAARNDGSVPPGPDSGAGSCEGYPNGSAQHMAGYAAPLVKAPVTHCDAGDQTRTCVDGAWSAWQGIYTYSTCMVEGFASCDGQPHGTVQTKYVYSTASTVSAALCSAAAIPLTRDCNDGTWSEFDAAPLGSVTACSVAVAGTCVALGDLAAFPCAVGSRCSGFAGRCVLAEGAPCTANSQCADTCIAAGVCGSLSLPGGSCDDAADCTGCSAGAQCLTGVCKCKDLSFCTANTECAHTCRANSCSVVGTSCDANDQADCGSAAVCRLSDSFWRCFSDLGAACTSNDQCEGVCIGSKCAVPSALFGACDNDDDCGAAAGKCSANVCLADSGQACTSAQACASGVCQAQGGFGTCK